VRGSTFWYQCEELLKTAQRGTDSIEPLVHYSRLAPKIGMVRRHAEHVLSAGQCAIKIAGLQPPGYNVVLQAQEHAACIHRPQQAWPQFGVLSFDPLQQYPQIARVECDAAAEHIDHGLYAPAFQCNEEMRRKVDAMCAPPCGARGVQPNNTESDRQPPASIDHADQIGIG